MDWSDPGLGSDPRYEVKMVCEERARPAIEAQLKLHDFAFHRRYPPRTVQSVYFDTHEGRALFDNIAGIAARQKLRFRWYGEASAEVSGVLELKIKQDRLGAKQLFSLPETLPVSGVDRVRFVRNLAGLCPSLWQERLHGLEPVQWIRYYRHYYESADRRVRVTFDEDLRSYDLRDAARLHSRTPSLTQRMLIVECKSSEQHRDQIERLLQSLRLTVGRCSKFVMASTAINGPLASWRDG